MPKVVIFNNRRVIEPGAYARTLGGEKQAPDTASFGKVLIIDSGSGASFGGGSGSLGEEFNGKKSIYEFLTLEDFRNFQRGGVLWDIASRIFKPSKNPIVNGCESLQIIYAKSTTPGEIEYTFVGGGANGGTVKIKPHAEGVGTNGVENATSLDVETGFAGRMIAGIDDTAKFIIEYIVGTFKGNDASGNPFDGILAEDTESNVLVRTPEFDNVQELIDFFATDVTFNTHFRDSGTAVAGTGVVDAADLAANTGNELGAGGTETYSAAALDEALDSIDELDNTFFLADKFGIVDGKGTENNKILTHILTESKFEKFLVIGGGDNETEFDQVGASSIDVANSLDTARVYVVHGDIQKTVTTGTGLKQLSTLYHAATFVGRIAGLEPQVPATWKELDIDGVVHDLKKAEREKALLNGVVHLRTVDNQFVVNQEVNTLVPNDQFIFPDGQSPEGSVMRISALLNREAVLNLERRHTGSNANLSSPADVKSTIETLLTNRTATKTEDNLILSFADLKVTLEGSDYTIEYAFVPNGPINRLFVTSFIFTPSLEA